MAPRTALISHLHPSLWSHFHLCYNQHCATAVSICLSSILSLGPAPQDICGLGRTKSHQRPCMVPVTPQVVRGSQAQALVGEVVVLASSMEHFREWGLLGPQKGGTHSRRGGTQLVIRVFPGFLSPYQSCACIYHQQGSWEQGWDWRQLCSLPSLLQKQVPANCL